MSLLTPDKTFTIPQESKVKIPEIKILFETDFLRPALVSDGRNNIYLYSFGKLDQSMKVEYYNHNHTRSFDEYAPEFALKRLEREFRRRRIKLTREDRNSKNVIIHDAVVRYNDMKELMISKSVPIENLQENKDDQFVLVDKNKKIKTFSISKRQFSKELDRKDENFSLPFLFIFNENIPELDPFIGYIKVETGSFKFDGWKINLSGGEVMLSIGKIMGKIEIRTFPDDRFYVSFETDELGNPIGEFLRTPFIPMKEFSASDEYQVVVGDELRYARYYHPITKKQIKREEYEEYLLFKQQVKETSLNLLSRDIVENILTRYL